MMLNSAIAVALTLLFAGCSRAGSGVTGKTIKTTDEATGMKTHYIGRFAIGLPADFEMVSQQQEFRLVKVEEHLWGSNQNLEADRERKWQKRLAEIEQLRKPEGIGLTMNLVEREAQQQKYYSGF